MKNARGFTLIELLVVLAVIIILTVLGFYGYRKIIESSKQGKEIHAARALLAGFHAYAVDNNGKVIPGYENRPKDVKDDKGQPIRFGSAAARYPWRIGPYIDYNVDNILLVNNTKMAPKNDPMYQYLVTVYPSLGMNVYYVGGHYGGSYSPDHPRFRSKFGNSVVTNILQPHTPSKLIVFASAFSTHQGKNVGCWEVDPPFKALGGVGKVDYRWNNKAVVGYFDGHVELNNRETLIDMRRWNNRAAVENNPNLSF
jgi:prepilin-type N-terminal cleavage/methylation domain-containing protein/prepilin-type processing-associated H-X9-DG protein